MTIKVILFEDKRERGTEIRDAIKAKLPRGSQCKLFAPRMSESTAPYDDRLRKDLEANTHRGATLFVTDRDLSETDKYRGLSEAIVSKVASELGVLTCKYARGETDDVFERQRIGGDAQIILDSAKTEDLSTKVAVLAKGIQEITQKLDKLSKNPKRHRPSSPAAVMAYIMGRPKLSDQISLYGYGDQKMASEILPVTKKRKRPRLEDRLPALFGYWLYESILRFPGLLTNMIAAASYLNIAVKTFSKDKTVQKLFNSAMYQGPFSDPADPHWWRSNLDDLIQNAGCKDGNEFAKKKLKRSIPPCHCSVDNKTRAGWYCMVTKKPVSNKNSHGNISWFPQGADLARVSNKVYDDIGPWLGLY